MATANYLVGVGCPPTLANILGDGTTIPMVLGNTVWFQGLKAAGTAQNLMRIDASDNTVVDGSGGFRVQTGGTLRWEFDTSGNLNGQATGSGDIIFNDATKTVKLKTGANGRTGTFTINGATPVVVSNTSLASTDMILMARDTIGGTPGAFTLTARTDTTSFGVTGTASDTSVCKYWLVKTA